MIASDLTPGEVAGAIPDVPGRPLIDVAWGDRDGEVVVTMLEWMPPAESAPRIRQIGQALHEKGYECGWSRTRVVVGRSKPAGPPDTVCRRS